MAAGTHQSKTRKPLHHAAHRQFAVGPLDDDPPPLDTEHGRRDDGGAP
jgi:hypothetical protein